MLARHSSAECGACLARSVGTASARVTSVWWAECPCGTCDTRVRRPTPLGAILSSSSSLCRPASSCSFSLFFFSLFFSSSSSARLLLLRRLLVLRLSAARASSRNALTCRAFRQGQAPAHGRTDRHGGSEARSGWTLILSRRVARCHRYCLFVLLGSCRGASQCVCVGDVPWPAAQLRCRARIQTTRVSLLLLYVQACSHTPRVVTARRYLSQ